MSKILKEIEEAKKRPPLPPERVAEIKARLKQMDDVMIIQALEKLGILQLHRKVWVRGYLSCRCPGTVARYHGPVGNGYAVDTPSKSSTTYHFRSYYFWSDPAIEEMRDKIEERCCLFTEKNSAPV